MPQVLINENRYPAKAGDCLKNFLKKAGVLLPCGGNGLCGKCKVLVSGAVSPLCEQERSFLSENEVAQGIRLACFTYVAGDCAVSVPENETERISALIDAVNSCGQRYGIAVDIGTTTVVTALCDSNGCIVAKTSVVNPQVTYGADVLTRAQAAAGGGGASLARHIQRCVNEQIRALCSAVHIATEQIDAVVITGNTVMLHLFTETPVHELIQAPFRCDRLFGEHTTATQCGIEVLSPNTDVYFPPCIDTFLGADFVCALQSIELYKNDSTALLADIGTNGEMALWHNGTLYVCSTAAGPAFEGLGVSCGMPAIRGAIDRVTVVNQRLEYHILGECEAQGICGSGLMDALTCLRELQELDDAGQLLHNPYPLSDTVRLCQEDVYALLLSKSAIRSGIDTLIYTAGITEQEVDRVYLAGGFGNAIQAHTAATIGLLPRELSVKAQFVGNAALDGARQYLRKKDATTTPRIRKLDLATDPYFADAFIRNMKLD